MVLDNDTRGWIMTAMSGIACCLGASIICVDVIVRLFPGQKHFKIENSNPFLSSSLSLSFGVMLYSSLYSMLPSAKLSLQKGGFSAKAAAWTLVALFLTGALGIQIVSRILHHYIPSHVVDCDHTHDDESSEAGDVEDVKSFPSSNDPAARTSQRWRGRNYSTHSETLDEPPAGYPGNMDGSTTSDDFAPLSRRPSLQQQISARVSQLVSGSKAFCDEDGQCYGYSDPCGQECFKIVQARGGTRMPPASVPRHPGLSRTVTAPHHTALSAAREPALQDVDEDTPLISMRSETQDSHPPSGHSDNSATLTNGNQPNLRKSRSTSSVLSQQSHAPEGSHGHHGHPHHHHVPTNAFLSIGLQTSIAIALHKLPEGFITYATNHANPRLGFAVFLALFIHNITEGFAMALPLYLAINSRWKAVFWSALLGGASQPLGAAVAALWFRIAGNKESEPGEGVYGGMFAVTAGIMASVALQLFSESIDLTHNRNLCMVFAFVGMGILGVSSALTA